MSRRQCELCGATDQEIEHWGVRTSFGDRPFRDAWRCRDRAGCRARVEASGQTWEWVDGDIEAIGDPQHRGFSAGHLRVFAANREYQVQMAGWRSLPPEVTEPDAAPSGHEEAAGDDPLQPQAEPTAQAAPQPEDVFAP